MCNACQSFNQPNNPSEQTDAFADHLLTVLNNATLALMISIGHRTGLFDAMQDAHWIHTCELAEKANLNKRYVQEWLGAMVTGNIIEINGPNESARYRLPPHHAEVLCQSGLAMGVVFQWIAVLAEVETKVVDAFKHGGGVPYEAYHRFHQVMAEESALSVVAALHDNILPMIPDIKDKLTQGIDVLDIGCGSGKALCELASSFPNSHFTGYDLCEPAISAATCHAKSLNLSNVTFKQYDITDMNLENQFDLITAFDVIHDQRDPVAVLAAVKRALKPEANFLMQDLKCHTNIKDNINHPLCPFLYTISTMHCMTVSLAQGGLGLGAAWGEELAVQMLNDAGFGNINVNTLPHDIQNNWYTMQKPACTLANT
ncbi:class I SAM-dependent methyltransferase [Poriferisphaera sp. WC338]|uniref:class I SAM-dependent methyltransferase n=1 Tax=Poriferisphaera sp. WC338 TaxID=3425129 RepID=UPI003D81260E